MSKNMNKKNNRQITSIKNEEFDALLEARYGIKKEDLEEVAKTKKEKEQKCSWSKPSSHTVVKEKVEVTPNTRTRMSQGDKGFLSGLIAAAGIWLLSKAKPDQSQQAQPLTAEQEYDIVERRLMRDAYLRHISRQ